MKDSDQTINLASLLIALGAAGVAGYFVYEVLSNDEAAIPIVGQAEKLPAPISGFRLFNLNVLHGYPDFVEQDKRLQDTAMLLRHLDPDVMVFQEVWNTNEHGNMAARLCTKGTVERLSNTIDFNFSYARANGLRSLIGFEEGAAIVSRFRLMSAKRMVLKPREPWWENRIALVTRLDIGRDDALKLVGVHLSNSPSADDQAENLLEILHGESPDIIVGDFNSTPESRAMQAMLKNGFVEAIPTKAIHGDKTFKLPNDKVPGPFIDHAFVSEGFLKKWEIVEAAWVLTSQPVIDDPVHARMAVSDHDGLLLTIHRR
jgi:endonuclease/exonuclease/phosphatase family metal-dependent hydrolase